MNSMVSRIISDGIVSCSDLFESKWTYCPNACHDKATENSEEILADLLLQYNKMRHKRLQMIF
jgi:hypothetical protein